MAKAEKPHKKAPPNYLIRSIKKHGRSKMTTWANSPEGQPLVNAIAADLYAFGFPDDEIEGVLTSVLYNIFVHIKLR